MSKAKVGHTKPSNYLQHVNIQYHIVSEKIWTQMNREKWMLQDVSSWAVPVAISPLGVGRFHLKGSCCDCTWDLASRAPGDPGVMTDMSMKLWKLTFSYGRKVCVDLIVWDEY